MDVLAHRLCSLASPDLEDARSSVMAKNRPTLARGRGVGGEGGWGGGKGSEWAERRAPEGRGRRWK